MPYREFSLQHSPLAERDKRGNGNRNENGWAPTSFATTMLYTYSALYREFTLKSFVHLNLYINQDYFTSIIQYQRKLKLYINSKTRVFQHFKKHVKFYWQGDELLCKIHTQKFSPWSPTATPIFFFLESRASIQLCVNSSADPAELRHIIISKCRLLNVFANIRKIFRNRLYHYIYYYYRYSQINTSI